MSSIHVKPAEGRVIRAPDGQVIPPEGLHLVPDLYLQRRLDAGDLVVVEAAPAQHAMDAPEAAGEAAAQAEHAGGKRNKKGTDA